MKMFKARRWILALAVLGSFAAWDSWASADVAKVELCHSEGNGSFHLIEVAEPAYPTHEGHGDAVINGDVPGMPGYVFGEDCIPIIADADGDGVADAIDNCPVVPNPDQSDRYGSTAGDACETDSDDDGILDVDETDICVSVNGVELIRYGVFANCESTASTGESPNIAVAHGTYDSHARARALNGNGNTAVASNAGYSGFADAWAVDGDGNSATADTNGFEVTAVARVGNNNTATAKGAECFSYAGNGDGNTAIGDGVQCNADAGDGNNNLATAIGGDVHAVARAGDSNTTTVTGVHNDAFAGFGVDNTATASGDTSLAVAGHGDRNAALANADGCSAIAGGPLRLDGGISRVTIDTSGGPINDEVASCP